MVRALPRLTAQGMSFRDAYLTLLGRGAIVEVEPLRGAGVIASDENASKGPSG